MIMPNADVDALVARLLELLEEEAVLLSSRRDRLAGLSSALAESDDLRLERFLEEMERELASPGQREKVMVDLLRRLAEAMGCAEESRSLRGLASRLPPRHRPSVLGARGRLLERARELRNQHRQTAMLLAECARLNRALLDALFPEAQTVGTYDSAGPRQWFSRGGVVDAER
jgi:hypothetical protein